MGGSLDHLGGLHYLPHVSLQAQGLIVHNLWSCKKPYGRVSRSMEMEEMAVGNFREFGTKCLHPESPLRKVRTKEGDNPPLRILRKLVACYPGRNLLQRGLDSEESTKERVEKEEEGGERKMQEGEMGPSDKAYLRTLWWKPVRSALAGDGEDGREGIHIPPSMV